MICFICLFIPAVLGVWLFEKLSRAALGKKQWFYRYCFFLIFINLGCFLIKALLLQSAAQPLYTVSADMTPETAWKYLVMALPLAVVFAYLQTLSPHIRLTVEEKSCEKAEKDR